MGDVAHPQPLDLRRNKITGSLERLEPGGGLERADEDESEGTPITALRQPGAQPQAVLALDRALGDAGEELGVGRHVAAREPWQLENDVARAGEGSRAVLT